VLLIHRLPENQPHRAEVAKFLVAPESRRQGIGRALITTLEAHARELGKTLLTFDTLRGSDAERLYQALGYQAAGIIPGYALMPDGRPCDTVVFWKQLPARDP
jgi:GNAT superfamily N-acetyltransferase